MNPLSLSFSFFSSQFFLSFYFSLRALSRSRYERSLTRRGELGYDNEPWLKFDLSLSLSLSLTVLKHVEESRIGNRGR